MRRRILLVISGTLIAMLVIITLASSSILQKSFDGLEKRYMERDVQRVTHDVEAQLATLGATTTDYATWTEMYEFARDPTPAFAAQNLDNEVANNLHVTLVLVLDGKGTPRFRRAYGDDGRRSVADSLVEWLKSHPRPATFESKDGKAQGIIVLPEGLLLAAFRPIMDSRKLLPIGGTLVMGRFLDASAASDLGARFELSVAITPLAEAPRSGAAARASAAISPATPVSLDTTNATMISAYAVLPDVEGAPAALLRIDAPRDIQRQGEWTARYVLFWLLFIGVAFGLAVLLTIERTILSRLVHLGKSVLAIGTGGNTTRRIAIRGRDQIAYLGAAINGMLDALERSTEELRASERRNEAFLDAVPDVIFRVTRDGTITDARSSSKLPILEAANDLVGRDAEQILSLYSFLSPPHFERTLAATAAALETGVPQTIEFHVDVEGGRRFYVERFVASGKDEAIVLVRDVTAQRQADETRRKEVHLKEIHHRVKNNLQVISSLLALQARATEDARTRALLGESRDRVKSMALIHEKLYQTGDERGVSYSAYVQDLAAHLRHSYAGNSEAVGVRIEVDEISLDLDLSVPCGLIITELLSNALKHAFPDGRRGTIVVRLTREGKGMLRLGISDDGIGFPPGVDVRSPSTLGLRIVAMLVEQIKGTLVLEPGAGTTLTITFPAG